MSEQPKWTPGPWEIECLSDCIRVFVRLTKHTGRGFTKVILARLNPRQLPEKETHANARLIAAAPELYGALEDLVLSIPRSPFTARATAALAKARGTSPNSVRSDVEPPDSGGATK